MEWVNDSEQVSKEQSASCSDNHEKNFECKNADKRQNDCKAEPNHHWFDLLVIALEQIKLQMLENFKFHKVYFFGSSNTTVRHCHKADDERCQHHCRENYDWKFKESSMKCWKYLRRKPLLPLSQCFNSLHPNIVINATAMRRAVNKIVFVIMPSHPIKKPEMGKKLWIKKKVRNCLEKLLKAVINLKLSPPRLLIRFTR